MKCYIGSSTDGFPAHVIVVDQNGGTKPLATRNDLRNHSPDGFSWGYAGSGPAQLALALLADTAGDEIAQARYQDFKFDVIAQLAQNIGWTLTSDEIVAWLNREMPDL